MNQITEQDIVDLANSLFGQYAMIPHALLKQSNVIAFDPTVWLSATRNNESWEIRNRMENVLKFAKHLRFSKASPWSVDAHMWETVQADLDKFEKAIESVDGEYLAFVKDYGASKLIERTKFVTHMLKAFQNGERFIVAKLSWNGGEA